MITVTVLHPGTMGAAITAELVAGGHEVLSVTKGRSEDTWLRAREAGATAYDSLAEALSRSAAVLSVCPPQAVEDVAAAVAAHGFAGVYADANAISPQRVRRIADEIRPGSAVVDGAVFGQPPGEGRATRLYLAGADSAVDLVASLFTDSALNVCRVGDILGSASALKMAFSSYQKAARTLAGVAHALADAHGVGDQLTAEAEVMISAILSDPEYLPSVAARAWRWAPEMEEVADTLRAADLPTDMAEATARVLAYWEQDKDQFDLPVGHALSRLRTERNS
ncbi:phosphogluconate dehydrogenase [Streptomyces sp. ZEA17I]|uniref:NAD(P)-dependent oxidoreductase n=1 Tax=Streptomyces sp. ZEA17I TaxID=2202516 RepID=UPI000D6FC6DD|nr:NAD(P)-dependent oxidoreductase [Streptomyces sp. ZEA17I]PWS43527.1 phosphogluconate dehydrogenase [Streptomyces sp. ZEA17I]